MNGIGSVIFCGAHGRDRQTDRQTDRAFPSIAIGRL